MITLFEPFRSKIKLHIRQNFLQELWDRYVPVSAESYDKISLIYLKGAYGEEEKGTKQVHVLADLVLKNLFMQINISQNPMLITQNGVSQNLRYTMKYYLAQLRRTDLQVFQSLNRYMLSLKQAEAENTRFESWKKDSQMLGQMEKEYQILRQASQRLRELSTGRSYETIKMLGTELLRSMKRTEYRIFAETMAWQEREPVQFRKDLLIWEKSRRKMIHRLEQFSSEEIHDFWKQICEQAAMLFEQRETELSGVQTEQGKETQELLDVNKSLCVKLMETWKKYVQEMRKSLQTIVEETQEVLPDIFMQIVKQQPILKYSAAMADMEAVQTVTNDEQYELSEIQDFQNAVTQIRQAVEHRLEEQKNRIVEREIEVLNRYQDILYINDIIRDLDSQQQEEEIEFHMRGKTEKEFLLKYRELRLSEEEIQKLWSWSRELLMNQKYGLTSHIVQGHRKDMEMFTENPVQIQEKSMDISEKNAVLDGDIDAEEQEEFRKFIEQLNSCEKQQSFYIEYRKDSFINEEVKELIRHIRQMDQKQYSIFIKVLADMIQIRQQAVQERMAEVFHSYHETQLTSGSVRKQRSWYEALQEEVMTEDRREFQRVVEQINEYGKQHSFHMKYRDSILTNEKVRELFRYTRQMDQEQYSRLIRALSAMIRAQQHVQEQRIGQDQQRVQEQRIEQEIFHIYHDTRLSKEAVRKLYDWSEALRAADAKVTTEERERTAAPALPPEESRYLEVEKVFRSYYGTRMTAEAIRELHDWSEALQTGDRPELMSERNQESQDHMSTDMRTEVISGDIQTEVIRRHIQQAKDRAELQQLAEQVNHYTEGTVRLEYREEQLQDPSVQKLIRHIRQLDEEEHRLFIRQLSKMIEVRQGIQEWEDAALKKPEYSEGHEKKQPDQLLRFHDRISQRVYDIYPELSRRIQEYEVRRKETYETELRQLTVSASMNPVLSRVLRHDTAVVHDTGPAVKQNIHLLPEPHSCEDHQDLQHAVSKSQTQRGKPEQAGSMQEEKMQIKSAQAQMDVRLKQVEQQLKQMKIQDNGKEDVRETAERIKKLLHEELHLEKLRRGMT